MPDNEQLSANPQYQYVERAAMQEFIEQILTECTSRIKRRIVNEIKKDDYTHAPSAAAVYKAIASKSNYTFTPYTGNIADIEEPRTDTIYLQRDDEFDTSWTMYVYDVTIGWINIGNTNIDLKDYWSKSEKDMAELRAQLGIDDKIDRKDITIITKEYIDEAFATADAQIPIESSMYTLTVNYIGPNGKAFASPVIDEYPDGATYYIPSPIISGYTPDVDIVKGVIEMDTTINVRYRLANTIN